MKQLLLLAITFAAFTSCSVDNVNTPETAQNLSYNTATDTNSLGMYKGVFTTNDSKYRGTVAIDVPQKYTLANNTSGLLYPTAYITLQTGEVIIAKANQKVYDGEAIDNLVFSSNNISFKLSINADGTEPTINEVIYKETEAGILIAKHTEFAPITPIIGTYNCDNCAGNPYLDNGAIQTFNMVFTNSDSDGGITVQVIRDLTIFNGIGYQDNCAANGTTTNCEVNSGDGSTTTVSFIANGNPVYWTGNHTFNNEATGPNDCSGFSGTWEWESRVYGVLTGTLTSDDGCFSTLLDQDFNMFLGDGYTPNPTSSQLDSDIFIINGFSDGNMTYGDIRTNGDFTGYGLQGGVTSGGCYSFEVANNDFSWGVQPSGDDFTPGYYEIKVENISGNDLSTVRIGYDIYVLNDENKGNSLNFSYSTDGTNFTSVSALDFTSPGALDANGWIRTPRETTLSVTVADGGFIYFRFSGDDAISGNGGRDEFALDNILVEGF